LVVLECTNCSMHAPVEGALSENVATVSLSTVPRLLLASGEADVRGRVGGIAAVRSCSRRDQITLPS